MLAFDAMSREVCTARRETTTTPLQGLVLLNDPQFIEAARVLAEKAIEQNETNSLTAAFKLAIGREPLARERNILQQLYDEQIALFKKDIDSAEKLLRVGESKFNSALPKEKLAAMTMVVNTLMNHDEFVMRR
jgi:hypothetical protein